MKIIKVVETCIYSSDLDSMKKFYIYLLGLALVQEEKNKLIFLKAGKTMLLIFDPVVHQHGQRQPAIAWRTNSTSKRPLCDGD